MMMQDKQLAEEDEALLRSVVFQVSVCDSLLESVFF